MSPRLTLFMGTLVQDSALSVSGIDRESTADQPLAMVDGQPILAGRGLKGAAVAMARRFFDPLPRWISEPPATRSGYRRSVWTFDNAGLMAPTDPTIRAGVGINPKTCARRQGVLYDREVVPAGARWSLAARVDWSLASSGEAGEAEKILGYVLSQHWAKARCWLGGGAARGLGWCHLENLRAYHLEGEAYDHWLRCGSPSLPAPLTALPTAVPTRSWCFRTRDLTLSFGEYEPEEDEGPWGVDMLAIGTHDSERTVQAAGDGDWARPAWTPTTEATPEDFPTDRAILMEGDRPLLPGSSLRGPLRHAYARAGVRQAAIDPMPPTISTEDLFGTVKASSRLLIRDGIAQPGWAAARLHMHAEDEFSAGSYGSAKRDAVRLLRGAFPMRQVVEGPDTATVEGLTKAIDGLVALGALGHLPVGGHKTRGAGWGRWSGDPWEATDVYGAKPPVARPEQRQAPKVIKAPTAHAPGSAAAAQEPRAGQVCVTRGRLEATLDLGALAALASEALSSKKPIAWWCEPTIDLDAKMPPAVFGRAWPLDSHLAIDEVAFFAGQAVWRVARTAAGLRWVMIEETDGGDPVDILKTPARLHGGGRFEAAAIGTEHLVLREWWRDGQRLGFTLDQQGP